MPERFRRFVPFLAMLIPAAAGALLMPRAFWIMDEAFGFLQVAGLSADFHLPPSVPWPGSAELGPDAASLRPLPYHYGYTVGNRLYCQYNPLLALLSLPSSAGGRFLPGLYLVPVLGAAACAALLSSRLRAGGFAAWASALTALAGTPLLFYSQTFWGHTAAIFLAAAAFLAALKGWPLTAALLLLPAALLREESLVVLPAILLGRRSPAWIRACAVLALAALFLCGEKLLTGSWLGTHIRASGGEQSLYGFTGSGFLARKAYVLAGALLLCAPGMSAAVNACAGAALWILWLLSSREGRGSGMFFAAGIALSAALLLRGALRGFGFLDVFWLKHPLLVFPALWLVRPLGASRARLAWPAAMLALLVLALQPMHVQDGAWGTRLVMLPLFLACLAARPGRRTLPVAALGILSVSVALGFMAAKRSSSARLADEAARSGGAVVATSWLLPGEFSILQARGTPVAFAATARDLDSAVDSLRGFDPVLALKADDLPAVSAALAAGGMSLTLVSGVQFDPGLQVMLGKVSDMRRGPP